MILMRITEAVILSEGAYPLILQINSKERVSSIRNNALANIDCGASELRERYIYRDRGSGREREREEQRVGERERERERDTNTYTHML